MRERRRTAVVTAPSHLPADARPASLETTQMVTRIGSRYPWPTRRPREVPIEWALDYGGRQLISEVITTRALTVVLEIGSFLGGSARQWLAASPHVVVVCVDHWPDLPADSVAITGHRVGRRYRNQLSAPGGLYRSFVASMWDVRNRIVHVRRSSQEALPELHRLGLRPDLVYLDADKTGTEIATCDVLFPDALIAGDDWNWTDGRTFPIRAPARHSASERRRQLKCVGTTWLLDNQPWTRRERLLSLLAVPRSAAQVTQAQISRVWGRTSSGRPRSSG